VLYKLVKWDRIKIRLGYDLLYVIWIVQMCLCKYLCVYTSIYYTDVL